VDFGELNDKDIKGDFGELNDKAIKGLMNLSKIVSMFSLYIHEQPLK
jgi:hypothetical protein